MNEASNLNTENFRTKIKSTKINSNEIKCKSNLPVELKSRNEQRTNSLNLRNVVTTFSQGTNTDLNLNELEIYKNIPNIEKNKPIEPIEPVQQNTNNENIEKDKIITQAKPIESSPVKAQKAYNCSPLKVRGHNKSLSIDIRKEKKFKTFIVNNTNGLKEESKFKNKAKQQQNTKFSSSLYKKISEKDEKILFYLNDPNLNFNKSSELSNLAIKIFKNSLRSEIENKFFIKYLLNLAPFCQTLGENGEKEAENIVTQLSFNLIYESIERNNVIFKYNQLTDYFYILLKGELNVLIPIEETMYLSEEEYFLYLLKLRKFGETDLLDKIYAKNFSIYFFQQSHFDKWIRIAYNTILDCSYRNKHQKMPRKIPRNSNKKAINTLKIKQGLMHAPTKSINVRHQLSQNKKGGLISESTKHIVRKQTLKIQIQQQPQLNTNTEAKLEGHQNEMKTVTNTNNNSNANNSQINQTNNANQNLNEENNAGSSAHTGNITERNEKETEKETEKEKGKTEKQEVFESLSDRSLCLKLKDYIIEAMKKIDPSIPEAGYSPDNDNDNDNEINVSTEDYINRIKPIHLNYPCPFRKEVTVFNYSIVNTLSNGEKFGEIICDPHTNNIINKRIATQITSEDCIFAKLDKNGYNKCLKEVEESMRKLKINFLLHMKVFEGCNKNIFMKTFSNLFKKRTYKRGDIVFKEGTNPGNFRNIYFVKNGELAVEGHLSIKDINEIFKITGYEGLLSSEEERYPVDNERYQNYINKVQLMKLPFYKVSDIVGLDEMLVNGNYIFTVQCYSNTCTVYEIHINYFKLLLQLDKVICQKIEEYEMIKKNLLIKFLLKQKCNKIDFFNFFDFNDGEPKFGCINFKKGQKSEFKDFLLNRQKGIKILGLKNQKTMKSKEINTEYLSNNLFLSGRAITEGNVDQVQSKTSSKRLKFSDLKSIKSFLSNSNLKYKRNNLQSTISFNETISNNTKRKESSKLPNLPVNLKQANIINEENKQKEGRNRAKENENSKLFTTFYSNDISNRKNFDKLMTSDDSKSQVSNFMICNYNNILKIDDSEDNKSGCLLPRKKLHKFNVSKAKSLIDYQFNFLLDNNNCNDKNKTVFQLNNKNIFKKIS